MLGSTLRMQLASIKTWNTYPQRICEALLNSPETVHSHNLGITNSALGIGSFLPKIRSSRVWINDGNKVMLENYQSPCPKALK